ncbi:MAG: hypothetical protein SOW78_02265, partial [Clostridia bacterium]|nr:hypothetical protein [Clostridia bacterium]
MAKLSASALRTAAANAREKNVENAVMSPALHEVAEKKFDTFHAKAVEPEPVIIEEKKVAESAEQAIPSEKVAHPSVKNVLKSYEGERKTEHVNLLITPSLSRKIEAIQMQGEFRS